MKYSIDHRVWPGAALLASITILVFFIYPPLSPIAALIFIGHFLFFRDPSPALPPGETLVSPAGGRVVELSTQNETRYLKEECVKIGICLTLFDVHVTRSPIRGQVTYLEYVPGKFMNALKPDCIPHNESNWVGLEKNSRQRVLVRQMAGAVARKIYFDSFPGNTLDRGEKLGVICYGSRVEFFAPKSLFRSVIKLGDRVKAGETILGEWIS